MADKIEGLLMFDIGTGKFWIVDRDNQDSGLTMLEFGDCFEVKVDDNWISTSLKIENDEVTGELVFALANTNLKADLNGIEVRK